MEEVEAVESLRTLVEVMEDIVGYEVWFVMCGVRVLILIK